MATRKKQPVSAGSLVQTGLSRFFTVPSSEKEAQPLNICAGILKDVIDEAVRIAEDKKRVQSKCTRTAATGALIAAWQKKFPWLITNEDNSRYV